MPSQLRGVPLRTVVLSAPGRDAISRATLENLTRQNPGQAFDVYRAAGAGGTADYWSLLRAADFTDDLLVLEDDVLTARNFLLYAVAWRSPHVTSFFCMCGGVAIGPPEDPRSFGYSQALWFPRHLVGRIASIDPPTTARAQDDALGAVLADLDEKIVYHRSLVQHTGADSLCNPGRGLAGRCAPDFAGESFDCLQLLR